MIPPKPLRIAVLVNTPPHNEFWNDVNEAYRAAFQAVAPDAQIDMYDPVFQGNFPNPQHYDLIVLSGGKADASSSEPWVLGVLEFLRKTGRESPKAKILGICWGHQAISRAFGGERLPEFHVREVAKPGLGFVHLAENHEMFVNQENTVLSFQAHPEVQAALAKKMLLEEDDVYNGNLSQQELEGHLKKLDHPTDGFEVLRRVIEWVEE